MSTQPAAPLDRHPDHDPMPQPPEPPDINACCGSGCDPCIFDAHDMAMDDYRQALRAWQSRQPTAAAPADGPDQAKSQTRC
ncbi:oxidoreductase-like domain-containing protein [Aquabacterium fontiphilum]|jgi:hypothetical protein|uniref:oxidoreductase-like domain-containing protein n=1 Tax=Aquabacterium fontiphilum TaxID=450365 RepID=UPI00191BCE68|nr:oxidoreductase-like domain-containing protein [Aquabacterium fontiphilum]